MLAPVIMAPPPVAPSVVAQPPAAPREDETKTLKQNDKSWRPNFKKSWSGMAVVGAIVALVTYVIAFFCVLSLLTLFD
jgi:hypothetical protein